MLRLLCACWLVATVGFADVSDFDRVRDRYSVWLLKPEGELAVEHARSQYRGIVRRVNGARKTLARLSADNELDLYDTRKAGDDSKEVRALVTQVLPALATAYQLPGDKEENPYYKDPELLADLIRVFDRMHARGFREPMQMPWKVKEVDPNKMDRAIIVDFHLRVSGYAVATFLMREELKAAGRLQRTLDTCEEIYGHSEKTGSLRGEKLGADGVRVALQFGLPYFLAKGDPKELALLQRQMERSMATDYDCSDTIKADGLGYHHRGAYIAGYASFAIAQATQVAWLFRDTSWALADTALANLRRALLTMRTVSNKYDMHRTLGGRLREIEGIPDNLLGYAYMADLDAKTDPTMQQVLARLADPAFMSSKRVWKIFSAHRNEALPGPGAITEFYRILEAARQVGAEADPAGNWSFNYGPLAVHRRDHWKVSVKGYSKYLWAFERSVVDARMDDRRQNVFGFHDSACSIRIYGQGSPVNAIDSGYTRDGWDWCKIPGATTRLVPPEKLESLDIMGKSFNRPYAMSPFCGSVSINGENGVFAQAYNEVGYDQENSTPGYSSARDPRKSVKRPLLQAEKSVFFFDDAIVALTTDVRNGDGVHPVGTTLFQTALPSAESATLVNGEAHRGLHEPIRLSDQKHVTLTDSAGNGYYLPDAGSLIVTKQRQSAPGYDGVKVAEGAFVSAWVDHGLTPKSESCEFVILPQVTPEELADFAASASSTYSVMQRNKQAHVVKHHKLGLIGYAVFEAGDMIASGPIASVDRPVIAMVNEQQADHLILSVCDPDLRWVPGKQYRHKKEESGEAPDTEATPVNIRLTVRGRWQSADSAVLSAEIQDDMTVLQIAGIAGEGVQVALTQADPVENGNWEVLHAEGWEGDYWQNLDDSAARYPEFSFEAGNGITHKNTNNHSVVAKRVDWARSGEYIGAFFGRKPAFRSEISFMKNGAWRFGDGDVSCYRMSVRADESWDATARYSVIFAQWKLFGTGPMLALRLSNDGKRRILLEKHKDLADGKRIWDLGNSNIDEWVDLKVEVKWSLGADGEIRIWRNDELLETINGPTLTIDKKGYMKIGMYTEIRHPRTLYIDAVSIEKNR